MQVVMVPGFTQRASSWAPVAAWAQLDEHELVPVDVPGDLDFASTASALGDLGGRAAYVGYSMGGRLCLQLALDRPELVERLVLISTTPGIADPSERAARRAADDELARELERDGVDAFLERWLAQPMFATLPASAADVEGRRTSSVARLAHELRALGQGVQPPNWDRLDEIRMPTALFVGSRDVKYRAIAELMAEPMRANMRVMADRGHACHLEDSGGFATLLASWLAG